MHTSILLVAMLGPGATPEGPALETLSWQKSYPEARKVGRQQNSPLAIFIGKGQDGWQQVCRAREFPAQARHTLAAHYVCVYVDTSTPAGRTLAAQLEVTDGPGLVLGTRDGENQAFHHAGRLTRTQLETTLRKYAKGPSVTRTETITDWKVTVSASSTAPASTAPAAAARPMYYSYPSYTPSYFGGGFGGGGGC
jgi:hypothetical protein